MLRSATRDGIGTITIDRPDKRNAMTAAMWQALPGLLDGLTADPDVRAVVLTGAGGNFCAGADIGELTDIYKVDEGLTTVAEVALAAFPKPTLAAVAGFCVGGGCQLALACDLRFAAVDARFGITPAKLGIVYPGPATERLVRTVGPSAAKYLLYSADLVDAEHARRIRLVDELVPPESLEARVTEFAATLASRSQLTQQATKDLVNAMAAGEDTATRLRFWLDEAVSAPDAPEGVSAFLERRTPHFTWTGTTRDGAN